MVEWIDVPNGFKCTKCTDGVVFLSLEALERHIKRGHKHLKESLN